MNKTDIDREHDALLRASESLIKYLNDNHNPHTIAIVTTTGVEVLTGEISIQDIYDHVPD